MCHAGHPGGTRSAHRPTNTAHPLTTNVTATGVVARNQGYLRQLPLIPVRGMGHRSACWQTEVVGRGAWGWSRWFAIIQPRRTRMFTHSGLCAIRGSRSGRPGSQRG